MEEQIMKIIVDAVLALLGVLITSGIPFVIGLLKQRLGEKKFYTIVRVVSQAVSAAELLGATSGWSSEGKKKWVIEEVSRRLKIDYATLSTFIEQAVAQLKTYGDELTKNGEGIVRKADIPSVPGEV